jgi:hypothetical protein
VSPGDIVYDSWQNKAKKGRNAQLRHRPYLLLLFLLLLTACAPQIVDVTPTEGAPGTIVSISMNYLVGWPRVDVGGKVMDWPQLKLAASDPKRSQVPGEELVWIEDKILRFAIPDIPPGEYVVTIHDDKGPPGDPVYSILETTAYVVFPPVWPYVFRSNQAHFNFRVLPAK